MPPDLWQAMKDYAAREEVQDLFKTEKFWEIVEAVARKVLPGVWGLIAGTASFLMGLVGLAVIGLYLVFLLMDYEKVSKGWKDLLPPGSRDSITGFVSDFDSAMNRYFRAQALVAAIVGILFAIGFLLIGLPMGIFLGLFIGLLNMVPYLQIIGLIPAVLLALVHALETGGSFWMILSLTLLIFVVVQIIQDAVLVPRIMGKVTGLNPAMILLSLSIWGKLLGMFGLLIALPMTCLLLAYYRRFLARNEVAGPSPHS
jgi:predicted PurR-regulated permease PerM